MTLEEYFKKQRVTYNGTSYHQIDHSVRAEVHTNGIVTFYIHPNSDGDTLDFEVHGNQLVPNPRVTKV